MVKKIVVHPAGGSRHHVLHPITVYQRARESDFASGTYQTFQENGDKNPRFSRRAIVQVENGSGNVSLSMESASKLDFIQIIRPELTEKVKELSKQTDRRLISCMRWFTESVCAF